MTRRGGGATTASVRKPARTTALPTPPVPPPVPTGPTRPRSRTWLTTLLLVLICAVLLLAPAALAAGLTVRQPTEYAAEVELLHAPEDTGSVEIVDRAMATHEVLLQRRALLQDIAEEVGRSPRALADDLTVELVGGSSVLRVRVVDVDPDRARETLDVLTDRYLRPATLLASTTDIGRLRVVEPPAVLQEPAGPQPARAGAAGLLLGLLLVGAFLTVLRLRRRRDRVR